MCKQAICLSIQKKTQIIYENCSLNFHVAFSKGVYEWLQNAQKIPEKINSHFAALRLWNKEQYSLVLMYKKILMNCINNDLNCWLLQTLSKLDNQGHQIAANELKILTQIHPIKLSQNNLIKIINVILPVNLCLKKLKNFLTNFSVQILL